MELPARAGHQKWWGEAEPVKGYRALRGADPCLLSSVGLTVAKNEK